MLLQEYQILTECHYECRFHVDKMSSAHVYLRLNKGQTIDDISEGLLEDCTQLVKANSIQGNKMNSLDVVYTPWYNLKKTPSMDVGQVGFYNPKMVKTVKVEKRINEVVNRLNKTKVERKPDLKGINLQLKFLDSHCISFEVHTEREAINAAERAERKAQLRDKVSCFSCLMNKRILTTYLGNSPRFHGLAEEEGRIAEA
ncbi:hypothetical protein ZIOFF_035324 [Zingiber officinale]|uniref:NFACT RNA-binding domain-containing protein n=1 Tax=Zingiber officinale TaxID=94328 RepID=A0A8J5L711_ZINOF|nr:hypothetical protein ZIOFF_035324 [Zingiber officinale]